MNCKPIYSAPTKDASPVDPYLRVRRTVDGIEPAGATDNFIGSTIEGDLNREQATIQSKGIGIHYATVSNATAIVPGDTIQGSANGRIAKSTAEANDIGEAFEASSEAGSIIRVVYY